MNWSKDVHDARSLRSSTLRVSPDLDKKSLSSSADNLLSRSQQWPSCRSPRSDPLAPLSRPSRAGHCSAPLDQGTSGEPFWAGRTTMAVASCVARGSHASHDEFAPVTLSHAGQSGSPPELSNGSACGPPTQNQQLPNSCFSVESPSKRPGTGCRSNTGRASGCGPRFVLVQCFKIGRRRAPTNVRRRRIRPGHPQAGPGCGAPLGAHDPHWQTYLRHVAHDCQRSK